MDSCILLVGNGSVSDVVAAAWAHTDGYLLFRDGADGLEAALAAAREGNFALPVQLDRWPEGHTPGRSLGCLGGCEWGGLTRREVQVARLMATGMTDKEIAEELGVSFETARSHSKRVLRKLRIPSRTWLAQPLWQPGGH